MISNITNTFIKAKKALERENLKDRQRKYGKRKRDKLKNSVYGSIIKIHLDTNDLRLNIQPILKNIWSLVSLFHQTYSEHL